MSSLPTQPDNAPKPVSELDTDWFGQVDARAPAHKAGGGDSTRPATGATGSGAEPAGGGGVPARPTGADLWVPPVKKKNGKAKKEPKQPRHDFLKVTRNGRKVVDSTHPYYLLLKQLEATARKFTAQLNKEPPDSILRFYMACLGFAIPRDKERLQRDGETYRHTGWKFVMLRDVWRAVRWAIDRTPMSRDELVRSLEEERANDEANNTPFGGGKAA